MEGAQPHEGQRLLEALQQLQVSQRELHERSSVSRVTIGKLIKEPDIGAKYRQIFANALGIDPLYFSNLDRSINYVETSLSDANKTINQQATRIGELEDQISTLKDQIRTERELKRGLQTAVRGMQKSVADQLREVCRKCVSKRRNFGKMRIVNP